MALDNSKEAKFTYKKEKLYDTEVDVIVVRDENSKNRRVCMIHPDSGTLSFTFRGTLVDFGATITFYSLLEMQEIMDAAKKINELYSKTEDKLNDLLEKL